jgi:hypothetical protein
MKRFIFLIVIFLTISLYTFCEVKWVDKENLPEGMSAIAVCTSEKEAAEVAVVDNLKPYFYSYQTDKSPSDADYWAVCFTSLGTLVFHYFEDSSTYAYYYVPNKTLENLLK